MKDFFRESWQLAVGSWQKNTNYKVENFKQSSMGYYKDLFAYKKAYELAIEVFIITKDFPKEEKYSLIDQIRRSSRSVCANMSEAFRRIAYKDYFISKLHDCLSENAETGVWVDFSRDFGYITNEKWTELSGKNEETSKLLYYMISNPQKFRHI